jgi:hypothetical protein
MMHDLRGRHLIGLGTLIGLLSLPLVGCASGPQPPPTATASTTPVARYATPTLPPTMQRLPLCTTKADAPATVTRR